MDSKKKRRSGVKCLNCPNKAFSRGCCPNCLHAAHRLIRNGEKSEQELIDLGMILPTKKRGRKIAASPFLKKLAKVKA